MKFHFCIENFAHWTHSHSLIQRAFDFFSGALLFNELLVQLLFLALSMRIYCTRRKGWRTKWNGNICEVCIYYSDGFDSIWPPFILLPHLFFCYFLHFICQSLCHFEMYFTRVPFIHVDTLTEKKNTTTILQLLYPLKRHTQTYNQWMHKTLFFSPETKRKKNTENHFNSLYMCINVALRLNNLMDNKKVVQFVAIYPFLCVCELCSRQMH